MIAIAKPNTWYKEGTQVFLEDFLYCCHGDAAFLCRGTRVCQNSAAECGKPLGLEYDDGEVCNLSEFEIIE